MWSHREGVGRRSLAALRSGERFTIRRAIGGGLTALCRDLGLREGEDACCRDAARYHVWVQTAAGSVVAIDRDVARYVEVDVEPAR